MSHNEHLVGRKGNILGKTNKTSSCMKDENSGNGSSALVTLRRKSGIKTTVADGPDKELSAALQRRSLHLENWEFQTSNFGNSEADQKLLEYERQLEEGKVRRQRVSSSSSPVVVNEQLLKILEERKVAIDNSSSEIFSSHKDGEVDDSAKFKNVITSDYDALKLDTKNAIEYQSVSTYLKASERYCKLNFIPVNINFAYDYIHLI